MAARLAGASSQYLSNAASPITVVPFTVGVIATPTLVDAAAHEWVTFTDTGAANTRWCIRVNTSDALVIQSVVAGTARTATGPTVVAGNRYAVVARFISDTNRWIAVVNLSTGVVTHTQNTQASTPSSVDTIGIGATLSSGAAANFFTGDISEFWYADVDIQADGAQLFGSTLRQLAMYGPFSIPHISRSIVEYRAFRSSLVSRDDNAREVYQRGTRQTWANTNGVIIGPHPPLLGGYYRPRVPFIPAQLV